MEAMVCRGAATVRTPFPAYGVLQCTFLWEGRTLLGAFLGGKHDIHLLQEVLPQLLKLSWRGSL